MIHREQRKGWKSGGLAVKGDNEKICSWGRQHWWAALLVKISNILFFRFSHFKK